MELGESDPPALSELTTVTDSEAIVHRRGPRGSVDVREHRDLRPDRAYTFDGHVFRTLERPAGEELARVATVNDVHFGETVCGAFHYTPDAAHADGLPTYDPGVGPLLRSEPGDDPYPIATNRAAARLIAASNEGRGPDALIAKGDLTSDGSWSQYEEFLDCYSARFGDKLFHVRGNHDVASPAVQHGRLLGCRAPFAVAVPGLTVAVLDTTVELQAWGTIDRDQIEWLDTLAAESDVPVLVMGHHPVSGTAIEDSLFEPRFDGLFVNHRFSLDTPGTTELIEVAARRPTIVGYSAGHTHRNRVRHFVACPDVPFGEVASTKEYPGVWAEYRVFEGGVMQVVHRITGDDVDPWIERTRALFSTLQPQHEPPLSFWPRLSLGDLHERCFVVAMTNDHGERVAPAS